MNTVELAARIATPPALPFYLVAPCYGQDTRPYFVDADGTHVYAPVHYREVFDPCQDYRHIFVGDIEGWLDACPAGVAVCWPYYSFTTFIGVNVFTRTDGHWNITESVI